MCGNTLSLAEAEKLFNKISELLKTELDEAARGGSSVSDFKIVYLWSRLHAKVGDIMEGKGTFSVELLHLGRGEAGLKVYTSFNVEQSTPG